MDTQQNTALTRALAEIPGPLPTRGVVHITLPHTDRFSVVGNHLAQHPELSLAAIGLAVRIQSLPRGTDISVKTLAAQCREGERLIASRLRELEACGYLQRARERRPDGRITTRTLYCNHPAALTAHHAQARPGTLPRHRSIPHQRSAPLDRPVPALLDRSIPAPHHRSGPAPLDRSIPAADPEHHAVAAPSPVPAPAPAPAPAERSAPAQEAARKAVPEADRTEAPEPTPPREPAREATPAPAREAAPEPAAVPAQGPAPTPVPAENPAPESEQTPAPAQPPTPASSWPSPMPRSAPLVPHPTARKLPAPPLPRPGTPTPQLTHAATALLSDLRRHAPELTLSAADIGTLAPAVAAWLEREAHPDTIRHALTTDLPQPLRHPAKLLKHRLTALLPPPLPSADDLAAPASNRPTVIPFLNCDGCERGIRSLTPGLCRDCREARAADASAVDTPAAA
ncbi:hypothetical protein [Streptomyces californicus]|uniref:hypothetical protein n=2 Tax=Streptomyces californicus TaxID=67351 RepID=UPI0004CC4EAF|nr:hypothetical protein [Streptomyces californicus]